MWFLGKIRESMESAPLELGRHIGKRGEDALFYSKTSLSQNLHTNIITPDNIPEFCLPPRLCKRHLTPEVEMTALHLDSRTATPMTPKNSTCSNTAQAKTKLMKEKSEEPSGPERAPRKPLPFSAECYGLAGMYESPNTRRKESLFHSKRPVYTFERRTPATTPRQAKEATPLKKTFSGFLPLFASRSTEAETPSSAKPSRNVKSRSHCLKETVSCPSLIDSMDKSMRSTNNLGLSLPASSCSWSTSEKQPPTLSPPLLHPLDFLHCQERLQHEHVLPLQGRGRVRLSAEHTTFSNDAPSVFSTIRVRVVSVEGLLDQTERQTLNCAVNLCLTPGKLQQQESATIRNCRFPVFNEDFYFTELSREDLLELRLRLKVLDKATAGALRRGTVIRILCKPLSQLLSSDERV
ncbi:LOW QUALITY PROTEIN: C2 calcium-dependent domain-containing protein 4C [Fundulus heteroclitus]|uniref:LOW QUALITY PROTEIN: C2 calcium-dependent domain-containing protein 4C n=1 Tax=Fundulus heteroclitus TaxID=8078 RepID=UPI00165C85A8|nr:LOW QUALITY PROTEIN: C2 calcium-dependent domain-containing protein 4C [Fundulus heteroclitus]